MGITFDDLQVEPDDGGRGRSRRRWMAGVGAAMLIAAAGGVGYGIGRSVGDDTSGVASSAESGAPSTEAEPAMTEPTVDVPATSIGGVVSSAGDTSASGGSGYSLFGAQPMQLVAERTTESGFTLRVHLGETWPDGAIYDDGYGAGDWRPAAWCFPSGQLRIAMSGNGVIDVGSTSWFTEPYKGRAISWLTLGAADGSPQWVIVAQTPPGTTGVTVTFADGATDSTTPQNGVAILTAPGAPSTQIVEGDYTYWSDAQPEFEVTFAGADGGVVSADGVGDWNDPEYRAACEPPPPALPDPGEQPADAEAAKAEIVAAMTALYDSTDVPDGDAAYLVDSTGVTDARAQVAEGGFSSEASSAQAVVEELVFTSPTMAWFRYRIDTAGVGLSNRYGIAVLVDDQWKITRDTVCQDLSMAGGDCGGGWITIQPPSVSNGVDGPTATTVLIAPVPGD